MSDKGMVLCTRQNLMKRVLVLAEPPKSTGP